MQILEPKKAQIDPKTRHQKTRIGQYSKQKLLVHMNKPQGSFQTTPPTQK